MQIDVQIVSSLTDGESGGNPAGVVIDADALEVDQKLEVARQVGLSETAFVSQSSIATIKLEFFTPTRQIAHCGHATIATFSLLRKLGRVADGKLSKETIDGCRTILVDCDVILMGQQAPVYYPIRRDSDLAAKISKSIGMQPAHIYGTAEPTVVNTGNGFLIVALPDEDSVAAVRPDQRAIEAISDELDVIGYYLFSTSTRTAGRQAATRMFAPRFGIDEESATGTAAGPLACFLYEKMGIKDEVMTIEQGQLMQPPSPSAIKVLLDIQEGRVAGLMAGGTAKVERSMSVHV
ncbi:PhzF family phenazine biosynthesis protein [Ralstonia flatus]|uniref:Isomerase YddE n=1 Tax=Ralstonia flatus TaxID=3058601 RepID=A0AAD2BWZ5_9RALS|nr:PhzF family phenazine biosynthesis protein [Ralstonia sp. LMG 32965]MBN6209137.1 PhzF family phenazine biosynthesis protein [Ralstonia pickettii]CAJ0859129.1 putative isomerase YddE [Ralstonia sp. LMG 32965]CAJ0860712.1 putative isomerase YddE [Ralstonia sp. LMG 32965]